MHLKAAKHRHLGAADGDSGVERVAVLVVVLIGNGDGVAAQRARRQHHKEELGFDHRDGGRVCSRGHHIVESAARGPRYGQVIV